MDTTTPVAIHIGDVRKAYGPTRALDGVNLTVRQGESHALLGRNGAGKSTLIGVLTGLVVPDSGTVEIRTSFEDNGTADIEQPGSSNIACVYQKSTLVPDLSAAENISLGAYPLQRFGRVDWREMRRSASAQLEEWGFAQIVDRRVEDLEPLERKVVEVCRAMVRGPRILLLDEPTAGLDDGACHELFAQIDQARARGVTVIYVSHHLDEVFKVCDAVTILRDGKDVHRSSIEDITIDGIVDVMTGDVGQTAAEVVAELTEDQVERRIGDVVLDAQAVVPTGAESPVDLTVHAGEAVGLTGLDGAGHIQLAQAIVGQLHRDGTVAVNGQVVPANSIMAGIRAGIGFVPEDRHESGFAPDMSVEENVTLTVLHRLKNKVGLIRGSQRTRRYDELSQTWSIKAANRQQSVSELSGGNQQKVVLARALASDPQVLVLIHPTAGVDVTAKESIYASIGSLQQRGCAVLIVSTDDEDLEICDRTLVMFRGTVHTELRRGWDERDLVAAVQGAEGQGIDARDTKTEDAAAQSTEANSTDAPSSEARARTAHA